MVEILKELIEPEISNLYKAESTIAENINFI